MEKKEENGDDESRQTCHVDEAHDENANEIQSSYFATSGSLYKLSESTNNCSKSTNFGLKNIITDFLC